MPRVFLDHVGVDPAQRQGAATAAGELIVERRPGHGLARKVAFLGEGREVGRGPVRVGVPKAASSWSYSLGRGSPREADAEPGLFHVGHVPDDAEQ